MNEVFRKFKEVDFWLAFLQRIISLLVVVIPAVLFIVSAIDKRMDEKLEPIYAYFLVEAVDSVDKQYQKIIQTPDDVKAIDIRRTIEKYDDLDDDCKTPLLEEKMIVIRKYALENNIK